MASKSASYNTSTLIKRKEDMLAPIPAGAKPPVMQEHAGAQPELAAHAESQASRAA